MVSHAGAVLLASTAGRVGLDRELSSALRPWRRPLAEHDPGKVLLNLAISVAIGGGSLADIAQVRAKPAVIGLVASDPTVSPLIDTLAAAAPAALTAINTARAKVRARAWKLAGTDARDHQVRVKAPLIVDLDATLRLKLMRGLAGKTKRRGLPEHPETVHSPSATTPEDLVQISLHQLSALVGNNFPRPGDAQRPVKLMRRSSDSYRSGDTRVDHGNAHDDSGRPVESGRHCYRANHYLFYVTLVDH